MKYSKYLRGNVESVWDVLHQVSTWEDIAIELGVGHHEVDLQFNDGAVMATLSCRHSTSEIPVAAIRSLLPAEVGFSIEFGISKNRNGLTGDIAVTTDVKRGRFVGQLTFASIETGGCLLRVEGRGSNALPWPLQGAANSLFEQELVEGSLADLAVVLDRRIADRSLLS